MPRRPSNEIRISVRLRGDDEGQLEQARAYLLNALPALALAGVRPGRPPERRCDLQLYFCYGDLALAPSGRASKPRVRRTAAPKKKRKATAPASMPAPPRRPPAITSPFVRDLIASALPEGEEFEAGDGKAGA